MFRKYPSIDSLVHASRFALRYELTNTVGYAGQIKLHGTNACVGVKEDGTVFAQKRNGICTPQNDNAGFAAWLEGRKELFAAFKPAQGILYIYGEWAGKGVQKSDAVSKTDKAFYIFDCIEQLSQVHDEISITQRDLNDFELLTTEKDIFIIPTFTKEEINFFDNESIRSFTEKAEVWIQQIGECDPYIKEVYGVEGSGEGLVFKPDDPRFPMFKLKTEAHSVNKRNDKKIVAHTPEMVKSVNEFVEKYATENRFNQALQELNIQEIDIKKVGPFIGWVCKDINKESVDELEANELEWKDIAGATTLRAREWYFKKLSESVKV